MNWCILIPIIVGILSALLGYIIGRLTRGSSDDNSIYTKRISKLQADLEACKAKKSSSKNIQPVAAVAPKKEVTPSDNSKKVEKVIKKEEAKISTAAPLLAKEVETKVTSNTNVVASTFDAAAAKAIFGKKIKQDDLKVVEGIGPKISELFHNHDIKTWKALSETSVEKCKEVLLSGGDRFKMHVPGTWPRQAGLAHEGKWEELSKWQDELDGGK